jgi:hypothetical protein
MLRPYIRQEETPNGGAPLATSDFMRRRHDGSRSKPSASGLKKPSSGGMSDLIGLFVHNEILDAVKDLGEFTASGQHKDSSVFFSQQIGRAYEEHRMQSREQNADTMRGNISQKGIRQSMHGGGEEHALEERMRAQLREAEMIQKAQKSKSGQRGAPRPY